MGRQFPQLDYIYDTDIKKAWNAYLQHQEQFENFWRAMSAPISVIHKEKDEEFKSKFHEVVKVIDDILVDNKREAQNKFYKMIMPEKETDAVPDTETD